MIEWAKTIPLLVGILTLFALFTGGLERVINVFISWLRREPAIVIRRQSVDQELDFSSKYAMKFSVINRRKEGITVNDVKLHMGDYSYGSTIPIMCWLAFQTFPSELRVSFVGQPNDKPFPILNIPNGKDSMGSLTVSVLPERGTLQPYEQIDIDLIVVLSHPHELKGKYRSIWMLGGQIEVLYEGRSLKERSVCYPASRDKALPF
jgi:hypothetical protein